MRMDIDRWPNISRPYKEEQTVIEVRKRKLCDWCEKANAVKLHHIDCNPLNNTIKNLTNLCNSCHSKYHSYFPNWRYLHDAEIHFIIKEAMRILDKKSNQDNYLYSEPLGDQCVETTKEELDDMMVDMMRHPLPY